MHDPALHPLSLVLLTDGCVTAALDILSKPLDHAGATFAARGLSTVVTDAGKRRLGYGRHLVESARSVMSESGADLGIFTCDRPLLGFYERAGWSLLPGTGPFWWHARSAIFERPVGQGHGGRVLLAAS